MARLLKMARSRHYLVHILLIVSLVFIITILPSQFSFHKSYISYAKGTEDGHRVHNSTVDTIPTNPPSQRPTNPPSQPPISAPPTQTPTSPPSQPPISAPPTQTPTASNNLNAAASSQTPISTKAIPWNQDAYYAIQAQGEQHFAGARFRVADEEGYINEKGRLVVDVNNTYIFWGAGQEMLCNLLRNMTLAESLDEYIDVPPALVNATMDCINHDNGQGNWVTAVYAVRMAAYLAGVDFKFQCQDGQDSKMSKLLPWFDQYQVAPRTNRTSWPHGGNRPNQKEACPPKYPFLRIDHLALQIQNDLRKMAVTLVGSRDEIRRHPDIPIDVEPLIPDVQLDDVALHFRCGDVLGGANRYDFGMIRFNEYKKWIPNNTESIGILTQPFEKSNARNVDKRKTELCREVVYALVDYLQEFAPNATISIHNGANETLPLAYARLVMANTSITSLSSFGIFPVVGTFGQGYFQKGNRGVNPFATYIPAILPNIHQMTADVNPTGRMRGKTAEQIIAWFVNDTAAT